MQTPQFIRLIKRFVSGYKRYVGLNFMFNILSTLFSLFSFLFSFFLGSFRCIHLMDAESIFSENLIRLYALIPFQIKLLKVFLLPPF